MKVLLMKNINMSNHLIPWWKINFEKDDSKAIKKSLEDRLITQGQLTERLEQRFAELLGVPFVLLSINGSAALLMALMACGIEPGDEVIVPNLTFIATAQAPLLLGAKIKLVGVESERPVLDVKKVEAAITSRTKAIIPVHSNGRAVDMTSINKIAAKYKIKVIEDAAQALFSKNSFGYLGTQSDVGVFSLGVTKLITTIQGGIIVTKNKELFKRLKKIRNHGMSADTAFYSKSDMLGFNFKFNDLFASIGLTQIKKIKEKINTNLSIYNFYKAELEGLEYIKMMDVNVEAGEIPLWGEVLCVQREKLIRLLKKHNIQAKPFSPNLSDVPYLNSNKKFKNSQIFADNGLILPSGSGQSKEDLHKVVRVLKESRPLMERTIQGH